MIRLSVIRPPKRLARGSSGRAHYNMTPARRFPVLQLEVGLHLLAYRRALDFHIVGQSVLVGRISLAGHERLQIAAAGRGDAEPVLRDEFARNFLFLVGDFRERYVTDGPLVWFRGLANDRRHDRVDTLHGELDGS